VCYPTSLPIRPDLVHVPWPVTSRYDGYVGCVRYGNIPLPRAGHLLRARRYATRSS